MAEVFLLTETARTVRRAAQYVQQAWLRAAASGQYPGAQVPAYVAGLQQAASLVYPDDGPLSAAVVNVSPRADLVELGMPAWHLPSRVRWGQTPRMRRSRRGTWYLRVPVRRTPLVIRTMTPTSRGWWIPATPATHIAAQVAAQTTPRIQGMLEAAMVRDIEALVGTKDA